MVSMTLFGAQTLSQSESEHLKHRLKTDARWTKMTNYKGTEKTQRQEPTNTDKEMECL